MPQRIQRRRAKGWRMPEGAVYVGRPTVWGNPYRVERINRATWDVLHDREVLSTWPTQEMARADAVMRLVRLFEHDQDPWGKDRVRTELAGMDLACWCPLDQPCHADVLLELANGEVEV